MSQAETPNKILMKIIREKHAQLPTILKETNIECWLIFVRETSVTPDPVMDLVVGSDIVWASAFIFYTKGEKFFKIAIVGNFDAPNEQKKDLWDEVIPYKEGISIPLKELISEINPTKIALNYAIDEIAADGLSHGLYLKISEILTDKKDRFISSGPIIRAIQGRKTKTELELISKACEITEEINRQISTQLRSGMSEIEIQQLFRQGLKNSSVKEAWQRESCPAIDAGPDKEFGHIGPSEDSFTKQGHTLHNDFGVKYKGYCSDLQRMWFFGNEDEIPEELMHAFETVKQAIIEAADYIKPGMTGYSVDKIARDFVISRGYEEYAHALGHQIGRHAHDGGLILGPLWERYGDIPRGTVEEGNTFTLELHVKTQHYGTVSLEENVVITKDGCRFLVPPQERLYL
ncbi:MAG: M24 family metallopeptidase, partial [Candidatus Hodarchaeales archaeon]